MVLNSRNKLNVIYTCQVRQFSIGFVNLTTTFSDFENFRKLSICGTFLLVPVVILRFPDILFLSGQVYGGRHVSEFWKIDYMVTLFWIVQLKPRFVWAFVFETFTFVDALWMLWNSVCFATCSTPLLAASIIKIPKSNYIELFRNKNRETLKMLAQ